MKNTAIKMTALVLCAVLLFGATGAALTDERAAYKTEAAAPAVKHTESADISKEETVYVLAGADGAVKKIIVSDWIKNTLGAASLEDRSELSDIENINGDESYTLGGDNTYVWDAQGNDIYYQGNIEKELPVELSVTYKLDGKTVSPSVLAGKSGRVTIRFDYRNKQYDYVEIDGKKEKIYVPFAMLTGVLLDNERFTNVEITNGKLINDGDRIVAIGIAFPGILENFAVDSEKLEIPDYVEITADVTDFELGMTVTLATNEIFNEINTEHLDSVGSLGGSLGELTDAVGQLMDGSSQLYGGLCTLLDKSGELVEGIDKLAAGAKTLKDGAGVLDAGAADLQAGAAQLYAGLNTLTANNDTLNDGAKQVFETLLASANTQLAAAGLTVPAMTVENYAEVLNGVIASLDETTVYEQALAKVTAAVEEQRPYIEAQVTAVIRKEVTEQVSAAVQEQAVIDIMVEEQMKSDAVRAAIAKNTELQIQKAISDNMAGAEVQSQLAAASKGAQSVISLKASLDSYNTFYLGLQTYTAGVAQAAGGAGDLKTGIDSLKDGSGKLYTGASELYDGILTLKNGAPALVDGITQLRGGAMQLSDGLKEFNEKGVQALVEAIDGDLAGFMTRLRATVDVSKHYQSFSGAGSDIDGQVKFIYRTDSVQVNQ